MVRENYKMSVRGSKNKVIIYIAGACIIVSVMLLYRNASHKLEAVELAYERCHLNEESLAAQLQVNVEYKLRLEKSLQREKSDHAQTKEELQNKLEEERQIRERGNLEAINKFSALQQQYKLLQSQHEDVSLEFSKLRQLQLSEVEEKKRLEELIVSLKKELKLLKEGMEKDSDMWKIKITKLEEENSVLLTEKKILVGKIDEYEKLKQLLKTSPSDSKLSNSLPPNPFLAKSDRNENQLHQPNFPKEGALQFSSSAKSSTTPNKVERELLPSANSYLANTSTPMINPQAVQDDYKVPIAPMPQPKQESSSMKDTNTYEKKENVGLKPDEMARNINELAPAQVLRAPDFFSHFAHVPEIKNYKKQLKDTEKNDHGGEVGDEDDSLMKDTLPNQVHLWREGGVQQQPLAHQIANVLQKNPGYQYAVEDDERKGEDDNDNVDPLDYHQPNEKSFEQKDVHKIINVQMPLGDRQESAILQPK